MADDNAAFWPAQACDNKGLRQSSWLHRDTILVNVHAKDPHPVEWTTYNGTGCSYRGSVFIMGYWKMMHTFSVLLRELLRCTRNVLSVLRRRRDNTKINHVVFVGKEGRRG